MSDNRIVSMGVAEAEREIRHVCFPGSTFTIDRFHRERPVGLHMRRIGQAEGERMMLTRKDAATVIRSLRKVGR